MISRKKRAKERATSYAILPALPLKSKLFNAGSAIQTLGRGRPANLGEWPVNFEWMGIRRVYFGNRRIYREANSET
jgi:hypothetical protein